MQTDKTTCWYQPSCIDKMNEFYDATKNNQEVKEHLKVFVELLALTDDDGGELLDLGCGTAMLSEYISDHVYVGADLPPILSGCSMRNYPQYRYQACDICNDDLSWINKYKITVLNGVIDVMEHPLEVLGAMLNHAAKYVIIHRQEITEQGETKIVKNGSYGGETFHCIINRAEFNALLDECNFSIVKELPLAFGNWENGGSSFLLRRMQSYALYEMDYKLNKIFKNKKQGFFIEAGANDGKRQSNTYFLEFYKNWKGLLIEPVYEKFAQCMENRSRQTLVVNAALVQNGYHDDYIDMIHTPNCHGMLSVVNDDNAPFMMKRAMEPGIKMRVPAKTLNECLAMLAEAPQHIDLLILDVEGYEYYALQGIDFEKWKIEYLLIEQLDNKTENIAGLIEEYYELVELLSEHDYLYKRKASSTNTN